MAWLNLPSRYVDIDGGVWAVSVKVDEKYRRARNVGVADPPSRHGHLVFGPMAMNCYGWFVVLTDYDRDGVATKAVDAGRALRSDILALGNPYIFTDRALDAANEQIETLRTDVVKLEDVIRQLTIDRGSGDVNMLDDLKEALHLAREECRSLKNLDANKTEQLTLSQLEATALRSDLNKVRDELNALRRHAKDTTFIFSKDGNVSLPDPRTYGWRIVCKNGKPSWASTRYSIADGALSVTQEGDLVDSYWSDDRPHTLLARFGGDFDILTWRDGVIFDFTNTPIGVVFTVLGYSQHWCVRV